MGQGNSHSIEAPSSNGFNRDKKLENAFTGTGNEAAQYNAHLLAHIAEHMPPERRPSTEVDAEATVTYPLLIGGNCVSRTVWLQPGGRKGMPPQQALPRRYATTASGGASSEGRNAPVREVNALPHGRVAW